jgi:competence protein ComEC
VRFFVLAFVLGTCWLQQQPVLPEASVAWCGVAAWLAAALVPARRRGWRVIPYAVAGLCIGIGLGAGRAQVRLADALPPEWEGRDIAVTGVVASLPQVSERARASPSTWSRSNGGAVVPAASRS